MVKAFGAEGRVLVVTYGGGHAAAVLPVVTQLLDQGLAVDVLGLTTAKAYFERHGISAMGIADICDVVPGYENARQIGAALSENQPRHASVSPAETAAYLGVGYLGLVHQLGETEARARYDHLGRQAFCPTDFFKQLFALARPALVMATSAPRSERAAMEAAAACGIASLCLVDLYAPFEVEWCGAPGYATKICVLNDAVARRFRDHGTDEEAIVVTGNPAFDRLGEVDISEVRMRHRAALGLAETDRLVVWISQPEPLIHPFSGVAGDPALPITIEQHLAVALLADPSIQLRFRLHPSEDRQPAVNDPRVVYSDSREPLDALLCAADCVVTCSSTVGLEAAMLSVPVVQLMNSVFSPDLPLGNLGVARPVPTHYEATAVIMEIVQRGSCRPRERTMKSSFNAAAAVRNEILQLLRKPINRGSND